MKRPVSSREATRWRAQRRRRRAGISLRDAGITEKTRSRYYAGLHSVLLILNAALSWRDLDLRLADWIEAQWSNGEPIGHISDTLCGLSHYVPQAKHQTPESWSLFKVWRKVERPSRAPPFPPLVIWGLIGYSLHTNHLRMAAVLALGFHACLRTGEVLSVAPRDFLLKSSHGLLRLTDTKSSKNADEFIRLDDERVLMILRLIQDWIPHRHWHKPIWDRSPQAFRTSLAQLLTHFLLQAHGFRGYSLRRGGATHHFDEGGSLEKTLLFGRWQSSRVARIYLCDGLARLSQMRLSDTQRARLTKFASFHF